MSKINKDIRKTQIEIERLKNIKVKNSKSKTLKDAAQEFTTEKNENIIKMIKSYNWSKGSRTTYLKDYANILKIHPSTFSKKVNYFNEHQKLPIHKNKGQTTWNKTSSEKFWKLLKKQNQY